MISVQLILLVIALVFVVLNALGKAQLWPAVLCVIIALLVR